MKKYLLIFVFCIQIFLSLKMDAFAFSDLTKAQEEKISDLLSTGIMKGDELGRFRPNDYLTKAEAATIVTRLKGYTNSYMATPSTYKDVPKSHWGSQIIGLATTLGLVKGDEYNNYYPDKNLNSAELVTMCLRVVGVGELLDSTGRWPYAHMEFCSNEGIGFNINKTVYEPITRLEAAGIVTNFLTANIWEKNFLNGIYEKTDEIVMSKYLGITYYDEAIITGIDKKYQEVNILIKNTEDDYSEILEDVKILSNIKIDDYEIGNMINVYVKSNQIIKIDVVDDSDERIINFDNITEFNFSTNYLRLETDGKIRKYSLSENFLEVIANGETVVGITDNMSKAKRLIERTINYYDEDDEDEEIDEAPVTGKVLLDANNDIISISLAKYQKIIFVKSISSEKITGQSTSLHTKSGVKNTSLYLRNKEYEIKDIYGETKSIDDISKNDVLMYTNSGEPYMILLLDDSVFGKVTNVDEDFNCIEIGGTEYYLNEHFCSTLPDEGDRVQLYLDSFGKIIGWKY